MKAEIAISVTATLLKGVGDRATITVLRSKATIVDNNSDKGLVTAFIPTDTDATATGGLTPITASI